VRRALAGTSIAALGPVAAASAPVTFLPPVISNGERATLVFSAPNERAPHSVVSLLVTAPAGVELSPLAPPPGWQLAVAGERATWSGGRVAAGATGEFRVSAKTRLEASGVTFVALQRYDDGGTVRWRIPFTILPATSSPKQHLWPAFLAGAVGLVVIVGGLGWLRRRQRAAD
jgi:uncharacterized protein YcnI